MPVHPAPPSDIPSLIDGYRATVTSFTDVAAGLRDDQWDLPTTCPGWTARDHLAHVVHVEDYLSGSEHPASGWSAGSTGQEGAGGSPEEPVEVGRPEHVRNEFGAWLEEGVRARRHRDPKQLIEELRGLMEVRSAGMYDPDLTMDTLVRSPMGDQLTFEQLTRLRLSDIWIHEQDLREVVGRPGSLDSPGSRQWTDHVMSSLARVVVGRVKAEPGTVVILESTGPVEARAGVRVGLDEDGSVVGHELFSGQTEDDGEDAEDLAAPQPDDSPEQITTILLSTDALTRRAAGRRSTEDTAYQVIGDEDLARRVLDAYALTP